MVNELGNRIRRGETLIEAAKIENLLAGKVCVSKAMHPTWYRDYLGYGLWYHGSEDFRVMQIFWPDDEGRYPWDTDCNAVVVKAQPDLSMPKQ